MQTVWLSASKRCSNNIWAHTHSVSLTPHPPRVVVGAPVGTYPGGLSLSDPGKPAVNRTGLVYDCSVIPNRCGPVLGDDVAGTTVMTDTNVNGLDLTVDNDFLSAGGRLFDHRRMHRHYTLSLLTPHFSFLT